MIIVNSKYFCVNETFSPKGEILHTYFAIVSKVNENANKSRRHNVLFVSKSETHDNFLLQSVLLYLSGQ